NRYDRPFFPRSEVSGEGQGEAAFGARVARDALAPVERAPAAFAVLGKAQRQPRPDIDARRAGLRRARRERAEPQRSLAGAEAAVDDDRPVGEAVALPRTHDTRLRISVEPEAGGQRHIRDAAAGHDGERGAAFGTRRDALLDREIDRQPRQRSEGETQGQFALPRPLQRDRRAAIAAHAAGFAKAISEPNARLAAPELARSADGSGSVPRPF